MKTNGRVFVRARRVARLQRRVNKQSAAGNPITYRQQTALTAALIALWAAKAELLRPSLHSRNQRLAFKC